MKRPGFAFALVAFMIAGAQVAQASQVTISCSSVGSDFRPWNDASQPTWKEILGPILITIDTSTYRVVSVHARLDACSQRTNHGDLTWDMVNDDFATQRFDQNTIVISIDDQQVANDQRNSTYRAKCWPHSEVETWTLNRQEGTLAVSSRHPDGTTEIGKTVACQQVHGQTF